ncbi:MAG: hypothetical protein IPK84_01685 [Candidatus Moraniibacteriota bacterium]|nr:MAG: hypothetical protein IPK84_01685 [Candidatus Moranbacteria bacterium]
MGIGILVIIMGSSEESNRSVTQETNENPVKAVEYAIEAKKTSWDDITVWAYKNSEKGSAIEMAETMGMKEYSTCH